MLAHLSKYTAQLLDSLAQSLRLQRNLNSSFAPVFRIDDLELELASRLLFGVGKNLGTGDGRAVGL